MTLEPRPGFDWSRVRWDDADKPQRNDCSYCGVAIHEDEVPLRMWKENGDGCVLCDPCSARWFGLMPVGRDDEDQEDW
jgi:hypothetical protein